MYDQNVQAKYIQPIRWKASPMAAFNESNTSPTLPPFVRRGRRLVANPPVRSVPVLSSPETTTASAAEAPLPQMFHGKGQGFARPCSMVSLAKRSHVVQHAHPLLHTVQIHSKRGMFNRL